MKRWIDKRCLGPCCVLVLLLPACGAAQGPDTLDMPPLPPGSEWIVVEKAFAQFPDLNREAVMTVIDEEFSEELAECKALSIRRLSQAAALMTRVVADAAALIEAREQNPELYAKLMLKRALEKQVLKLAAEFKRKSGEADGTTVEGLREMLGKVFELKQEFMRLDVGRMEKDLDQLKALIARREGTRKRIVERRLGELLGDPEALNW